MTWLLAPLGLVIAVGICLELIDLAMSSLRETRDEFRRNPL